MKTIIVDDNKQFRTAFRYFLEVEKKNQVIAEATTGKEAIELEDIHQADIIFMDIEMPEINGILATKKILENNNTAKIIGVTMYTDKAYLRELIEAGFKGFIFKNNLFEDVDNAIREVENGGFYFPDDTRMYYY